MSLWDRLLEEGAAAAREAAGDPAWVRALTDAAHAELEGRDVNPAMRAAAEIALDAIDGNAERIAGLGQAGLVGLMGSWGAGGEGLAREVYLRHHAPAGEVLAAMDELDGASVRHAQEGGSAWEWIAGVFELIEPALPVLLPLIGLVV